MLNRFLSILILLSLCQSAWAGVSGIGRLSVEAPQNSAIKMASGSEPCHHGMLDMKVAPHGMKVAPHGMKVARHGMKVAQKESPSENASHSCCEDAQDQNHNHCQHSCHQPLPVSSAIPAALVLISAPTVTVGFNRFSPQPLPAEPNLPERPPSVV